MKQKYEDAVRDKIEDQNQKLKNCNKIVNETINLGNNTNVELERQTETIDRIDKNLDHIDDELSKSKWLMRGIKSTFGMLWNGLTDHRIFGKKKNKDKSKKQEPTPQKPDVEKKSAAQANADSKRNINTNKGNRFEKELDQQDELLDELNNNVLLLKGIAQNTGNKLDDQNKKLDLVNKKVEDNNKKMNDLNKDMKGYLGKN